MSGTTARTGTGTARIPAARPKRPSRIPTTLAYLLGFGIVALCLGTLNVDWSRLWELPGSALHYLGLLGQDVVANPLEEPRAGYWLTALDFMLDSLYIAWLGTLIGAVLSLPLGFLAAANVSPLPVVLVARGILNAIRAIPEVIIAIAVLLPLYGLVPSAGALAIGIGSVGTLGKLTSEAIEGISPGPVEALRATGANQVAVLRWGVLPQVLPEIIAFWLYRFEINIRAGAILGALGLGGIGFLLDQYFTRREWGMLGIALVVTIVVTIIVDQISAAIRHRVIGGQGTVIRSDDAEMKVGATPYG